MYLPRTIAYILLISLAIIKVHAELCYFLNPCTPNCDDGYSKCNLLKQKCLNNQLGGCVDIVTVTHTAYTCTTGKKPDPVTRTKTTTSTYTNVHDTTPILYPTVSLTTSYTIQSTTTIPAKTTTSTTIIKVTEAPKLLFRRATPTVTITQMIITPCATVSVSFIENTKTITTTKDSYKYAPTSTAPTKTIWITTTITVWQTYQPPDVTSVMTQTEGVKPSTALASSTSKCSDCTTTPSSAVSIPTSNSILPSTISGSVIVPTAVSNTPSIATSSVGVSTTRNPAPSVSSTSEGNSVVGRHYHVAFSLIFMAALAVFGF